MRKGDRSVKLVEWSDEDGCFIGSRPEMLHGDCHGSDAKAVFAELCDIVEDATETYEREGRPLPEPPSGREFVNAEQSIA